MDNGTILTSVIGASAATIAVVVAKDAKISEIRQSWIDALRDDVSRESAVLISLHAHLRRVRLREANRDAAQDAVEDNTTMTSDEQWAEFYANGLEANQLSARIALRLDMRRRKNPKDDAKKESQRELHALVGTAHQLASNPDVSFDSLSEHLDKVRIKTSEVLEVAWRRVKQGEFLYRAVLWTAVTSLVLSVAYAFWSSLHASLQRPTLDIMVTKPIQVEQSTPVPIPSQMISSPLPPLPSQDGKHQANAQSPHAAVTPSKSQ